MHLRQAKLVVVCWLILMMTVTWVNARVQASGDQTQANFGEKVESLSQDSASFDIDDEDDFGDLGLEELMQIEVTSVAGVAQPLLITPSAVYVITNEDLRRSGHQSIAEALRMVPGMNVAKVASNKWAISSRGFNSQFAGNLLVLVDGRSVYDQLFSGVFWDIQDLPLEDIDRIEVIRGPGATLWGVNAVNGVINITTKHARDTQGLYLSGGGGNELQGFGDIRYGGQIGDNAFYRVWATFQNNDSAVDSTGGDRPDDWSFFRGGARFDWEGPDDLQFTLQGDGYTAPTYGEGVRSAIPGHQTFANLSGDGFRRGGNVLMRLSQETSETSGWSFQAYYDRFDAKGIGAVNLIRDTADVDFRHHFSPAGNHAIIWGGEIRYSRAQIESGPTVSFRDPDRETYLFSGFLQDTMTIVPDRLTLMLGSKISHNDFTGFEIQPSARLTWTPNEKNTMWGAVSRAVSTPSRADDDLSLITTYVDTGLAGGGPASGIFVPLLLTGSSNIDSEELIAFELGYRTQMNDDWTLDVAGFFHDYDRQVFSPIPSGSTDNRSTAEIYGVEVSSTLNLSENWRMFAGYSYLQIQVHATDPIDDAKIERQSPHNQFNIRTYFDVTDNLELNAGAYYVDTVPDFDVPAYWRFDVGLTWRPSPNVEYSIWVQNIFDESHLEFGDDFFLDRPTEIERSVYAQVSIHF